MFYKYISSKPSYWTIFCNNLISVLYTGCGSTDLMVANEIPQKFRFYDENIFYPNNLNCSWDIVANGSEQRVRAKLTLYVDSLAEGDLIGLRDEDSLNASLNRNDTNTMDSKHLVYESSGRNLTVSFKSDGELVGSGFTITYDIATEGMTPIQAH